MADRLYRSRDDRMLAGVAGGLARVMDADPSIIRVVWVVITVLSGGLGLLVYIVMAIVVPEAPDGWDAARSSAAAAAPHEPVPPGGWLGPDGRVVPYAGTAPGATTPARARRHPPARPRRRRPRGAGRTRRPGHPVTAGPSP